MSTGHNTVPCKDTQASSRQVRSDAGSNRAKLKQDALTELVRQGIFLGRVLY